jgi:hypothetical protein
MIECLTSKSKVLSSNPNIAKQTNQKRRNLEKMYVPAEKQGSYKTFTGDNKLGTKI